MTDTLSEFMKRKNDSQQQSAQPMKPELKFAYIWQNLDNLFQQLDQNDVNDLNLKFISLTCDKINTKARG